MATSGAAGASRASSSRAKLRPQLMPKCRQPRSLAETVVLGSPSRMPGSQCTSWRRPYGTSARLDSPGQSSRRMRQTHWLRSSLDVTAESIRIRSRSCTGDCDARMDACASCKAVARNRGFWKHIAQKSYMIDCVMLAHVLLHGSSDEAAQHIEMMKQRDYFQLGYSGSDLATILQKPGKMEKIRAICWKMECVPALRRSDSWQRFYDAWLTKAPVRHSCDLEAEAHALLSSQLSEAIAAGRARSMDVTLAAKIAAGALQGESLVQSLITSFLMKYKSGLQAESGRYKTSSQHMDYDSLADALASLGRSADVDSLLRIFRVNPKKQIKIDPGCPACPRASVQRMRCCAETWSSA